MGTRYQLCGICLDEHAESDECEDLEAKLEHRAVRIATLESQLAASEAKSAELIDLLKRTYRAAMKHDWEEGECLNEVLGDVSWAMEAPEREAAMKRAIREMRDV